MPGRRALSNRDPGDETPESPPVGDFNVLSWRYEQLELAGYPVDVAVMLAERSDVDLHVACDLLEHGASVDEALRIIT